MKRATAVGCQNWAVQFAFQVGTVVSVAQKMSTIITHQDSTRSAIDKSRSMSHAECVLPGSIWDLPEPHPAQRSTLDLMPLTTYPSLINPRPSNYPRVPPTNNLAGHSSQDHSSFLGSAEEDVWAANQALQGMRSADFSMPYGSSPERMRIVQDDYNAYKPKRYIAESGLIGNLANSTPCQVTQQECI